MGTIIHVQSYALCTCVLHVSLKLPSNSLSFFVATSFVLGNTTIRVGRPSLQCRSLDVPCVVTGKPIIFLLVNEKSESVAHIVAQKYYMNILYV